MARISFGIVAGIAAGFAIAFGSAVIVMVLVNDDSLADLGD